MGKGGGKGTPVGRWRGYSKTYCQKKNSLCGEGGKSLGLDLQSATSSDLWTRKRLSSAERRSKGGGDEGGKSK